MTLRDWKQTVHRTLLIGVAFGLLIATASAEPDANENKEDPLQDLFDTATAGRTLDQKKIKAQLRHPDAVAQGNRAFRTGRFGEAIDRYKTAVQQTETDTYARYLLGCALFETADYPAAAAAFAAYNEQVEGSASAMTLERLSRALAKNSDAPLLETALTLLYEVRTQIRKKLEPDKIKPDPVPTQLQEEAAYDLGLFVIDGRTLRETVETTGLALTPAFVGAVALFTPSNYKNTFTVLQEAAEADGANPIWHAVLYQLVSNQNRPSSPIAIQALEALREADPDNGYYDATYAGERYGRLSDPLLRKLTVAQIHKRQTKLWNAVIRKVKYESDLNKLVKAYQTTLTASDYPFAQYTLQIIRNVPRGGLIAIVAKRLHRDIADAIADGNPKAAWTRVEECRTVALKILRDNPSLASLSLAASIFEGALGAMPIAEPAGETMAENWDYETPATRFATEFRKTINLEKNNGLLVGALSLIPVPRLQAAAIDDIALREQRMAENVDTLIADWTLPKLPKNEKSSVETP